MTVPFKQKSLHSNRGAVFVERFSWYQLTKRSNGSIEERRVTRKHGTHPDLLDLPAQELDTSRTAGLTLIKTTPRKQSLPTARRGLFCHIQSFMQRYKEKPTPPTKCPEKAEKAEENS